MVGQGGSEVVIVTSMRKASYADLEALPEHVVGELIDGELFVSPRPASRHALVASALGSELGGPFHQGRGGPGGWWIIFEPELHFGEDVLVPDFAGWRRERMPTFPDVPGFTLAPDWICEVLSPSTARVDLKKKLPLYARRGVRHAWLIDPGNRTLQVFRNETGNWVMTETGSGGDVVRAEPFEVIELELRRFWAED